MSAIFFQKRREKVTLSLSINIESTSFSGMIPGGQHVMLSYHGNNQDLVSKVGLSLKDEHIPVWFEKRKEMMHDLHHSLSEGVENAAIICCFISSDYEQCDKCKRELQYARKQYKEIIPCLLNDPEIWKPSDWLESITKELECIVFEDIPVLDIDSKIVELIYRIKYQPHLPQSLGSSLSTKTNYLFELIRHEYQQNSRVERLINPEKSYPMEQSYINLAIVTTKEQQAKERQLHNTQHGDAIMSTFEEIYGMKTTIDIKDIFKTCKNQNKQVLVLGRAGIGKSTFCRYVAYQWAMEAYWSEYELLALIPLRRLTADRYPLLSSKENYSLFDIVKKEILHPHLTKNDDLLEKQFNSTKTLWILDGYDEMVQNTPAHLEHLFEMLLKTPHHILTSRPYNISLPYDVQMEITGFSDKNIGQFVQRFYDQLKDELDDSSIKGKNLLKFLRSNPSIWGVAHIPVNLELICSFWSNEEWSQTTEIRITNIYTKMTEWLCRRYLKASNNRIQQLSKDDIDQLCQEELTFLETLAFNAMRDNIIILRPVSLQTALRETKLNLQKHPHILNIGILKAFTKQGVGDQIQLNKDHYFVHLSFQEYFAARYLINALKGSSSQQAIQFINTNKYNQRFTLLFIFTAGILADASLEQASNVFWDTLSSEPLDLIGIRHIQLIISCLGETSTKSTFHRRSKLMNSIIRWTEFAVLNTDFDIHQNIITSLARSPSLTCEQGFIDSLNKLLQHDHFKTKTDVCTLITNLTSSSVQSQLLQPLFKLLRDENEYVRQSACFALKKIHEKAGTSEVINELVTTLEDENVNVRIGACEALRNIGEKAGTSEVISKLVTALEDQNVSVRIGAWQALGKIGGKAGTSEVISKLVTALGDKNGAVQKSAWEALANIIKTAETIEVISKLGTALGDESWPVRHMALGILGQIGKRAGTSEVISKLVAALGDENKYVRRGACEALANIGEKAGTSEAISTLVTALGDENEDVRSGACHALGEIGGKAGASDVISKLVTALEDENGSVRKSTWEALGKIGEKAEASEVISKLVTALGDEHEDVRSGVCQALGKIGENAGTSEVVSKLVTALEDQNVSVRSGACKALRQIGKKAGTSEVISKLANALEDENVNVRIGACEALRNIGENVGTSEVISKLATALEDENVIVRSGACEALGQIGERAGTSEVINKLVTALRGESVSVRRGACEALANIGEKAGTSEAISTLVTALGDENEDVRSGACHALGEIGGEAGASDVISKLVTALEDENGSVRKSAWEALGKIGEKAEASEVISKLVTALGDEHEDVRSGVCQALGKISENAGTSEVVSKLVTALEDQNVSVRRGACFALGRIGKKAGTSKVVSKLVIALEAEDKHVRSGACEVLGQIGEKAGTSEVISKLATALDDESVIVRSGACEAVRNIGKKAGTSEVISKLVTALGDENVNVRIGACEALRNIGEKAGIDEVINKLGTALGDENEDVRGNAIGALGQIGEKAGTNEIVKKLLEMAPNVNWKRYQMIKETLQTMLSYSSVVRQLQSDTVALLYECVYSRVLGRHESFPPDHFINAFLWTKNNGWVAVASLVAFLQRNAVIVTHSSIIICGSKEPVELSISDRELRNQLVQAFIDQHKKLGLPANQGFETPRSLSHRRNVESISEPHPNSKPNRKKN